MPSRPVVIGREVAARPAQDRYVQILGGGQHILAVSVRIGERRLLVKYAAFDAAAQVLDEISVDLGIDIADDAFGIDLHCGVKSVLGASGPRQRPCQGQTSGGECTSRDFYIRTTK